MANEPSADEIEEEEEEDDLCNEFNVDSTDDLNKLPKPEYCKL